MRMNSIEKINKYFPKLSQLINEQNLNLDEIELLEARDGNLTIKNKGKLLHSKYKPIEDATKNVSKHSLDGKGVILLLGLGLGYYLDDILEKKDDDSKVFIVEDSLGVFKFFVENREIDKYLDRNDIFFFHTSQKYDFEFKVEETMRLGIIPDYEIILNKASYSIAEKKYFLFIEVFKNCISSMLINTSTIFEFSKMWHKNAYKNLKHFVNSYGVNNLFGKFKNIPIIIVASGPSLEKNIKYLHWSKGKAVIIAVGTVLKKLLIENIEPDFIVTMDGGEPNWEHFRRIEYSKYPIIYEPMVQHKILDNHKGDKFVFVSSSIVGSWGENVFGDKGFMKMGGSVAVTGYDFGVRCGGNPIILLGQDLAYTGGKTHVSGTHYEKDRVDEKKDDIHQFLVDDIYGEKVLSDRKFFSFIEYFQRFIYNDQLNNSDLLVYDCTEGGARIKYTQVKTFRDIYVKYIENSRINVKEEIDSIKENYLSEKRNNSKKLKEAVNVIKKKLNNVLKNSKDGIKIANSLISKNDANKYKKLEKIDEEINSEVEVGNLIRLITQPIISQTIKKPKEELSEKEILEKSRKLYKGIKEGVEFNLKCLEEIHEKEDTYY